MAKACFYPLQLLLYYQLEKGGFISTADTDVKNYSEILFVDSRYNGTYNITGVGTTTFDISLSGLPESLTYNQSSTSVLKYSTPSPTAIGGVDSMRITFGGANYKKLPRFVSIASSIGTNVDIIPTSTTLGRINQVTIQDPGFDFSADKCKVVSDLLDSIVPGHHSLDLVDLPDDPRRVDTL